MHTYLRKFLTALFVVISAYSFGQVPIVYYDFESNAARETTVETVPALSISGVVPSPSFARTSLTVADGAGNATNYGASNTGYALGASGFTTNSSSTSSDNSFLFSTFNATGFSSLTLTFDAIRDANGATNVDVYTSVNGGAYTLATFTSNAVSTSYSSLTFTLDNSVSNANNISIKIIGYNAATSGGTLKIDNLAINTSNIVKTANTDLLSAVLHGVGLSSGGTYTPVYSNLLINANANKIISASSSITFDGTITLTRGIFAMGASITDEYSLTMIDSNTPFVKTNGLLFIGNSSNLVFGTSGHQGGAAFVLPTNLFNNTGFNSLTVNRTNSISLSNQSISLQNDLVLEAGTFNDNDNTIDVGGNVLGTSGVHTSAGTTGGIVMTTNGTTLAGLTYGNIEIGISSGETISLSGNATINGSLLLDNGVFDVRGRTLTFKNGNTPIIRDNASTLGTINTNTSTNIIFGGIGETSGNAFAFPNGVFSNDPADLGALTINRTNALSLGNQSINVSGTLTLTAGEFIIGANKLTLQTANTLITRASGTITLGTTSSLAFGSSGNTGGTSFTIPDNTFTTVPTFTNFAINRTNAITLNNQNFTVTGIVTLTSGSLILPAAYTFTLASTAITNTALVDVVGNTFNIQYGSGANFLVERFIPQGLRAFRFIAPEVNSGTGTFYDNWQEGGVNNNGYGTQITGKAGTVGVVDATTGFDMTSSGNVSLFDYKVNTTTGNAGYVNATSTNGANDTLSAYKAYLITVRGNRANNLAQDLTSMTSSATLRSRGQLVTGQITFNTTGVTNDKYGVTNSNIRLNSGSNSGFTLIGNPYAAPIDWNSITSNGSVSGITGTYWVYDPLVGTNGAYVTFNGVTSSNPTGSAVNRYIQPGQGFFIQNNVSTSPIFQIRESDKAVSVSNLTTTFGTSDPISRIITSLHKKVNGNYKNMDANVAYFKASFNNGYGSEDAVKILNSSENLAINSSNGALSIDGRKPQVNGDTISLRLTQTVVGADYQLSINLADFAQTNVNVFLNDRFATVKKIALTPGIVNTYAFVTTADTLSFNNRFSISFGAGVLPVTFVATKAVKTTGGVNVQWQAIENNTVAYEVEFSNNGTEFTSIAKLKAIGVNATDINSYNFFHSISISNTLFYRLKCIDINGKTQFSSIMRVTATDDLKEPAVAIYPNPIKNNKASVSFQNMLNGKYDVKVYNSIGQLVYQNIINHTGGATANYNVALTGLAKGEYKLSVTAEAFTKTINLLIQ